MNPRIKDMTDEVCGRLTVIGLDTSNTTKRAKWLCECSCGNKVSVDGKNLRTGHTRSCGCLELKLKTKHGMQKEPIYKIWQSMSRRCDDVNNNQYKDYGGRGITVCDEWLKFENFYNDMGDSNGLTLDRKNNNKGYYKDNCRWATRKEQQNNKRNNRILNFKDKSQSVSLWADEVGLIYNTLIARLNHGWSVEDALTRRVA